jgi:colanic acid/amylovoran biosynthesis protein
MHLLQPLGCMRELDAKANTHQEQTGACLIVNVYSARNLGDAAITLATIGLLRSQGWATISVSSRYVDEDTPFYVENHAKCVPPVIPFPVRGGRSTFGRVLAFGLGAGLAICMSLVMRVNRRIGRWVLAALRAEGLSALCSADLVILSGGGYFYSSRRRINLTLVHAVATTKLATTLCPRVVMMPQSIGPLTRRVDQKLVQFGLSSVSPVVVREDSSRSTATSLIRRTPAVLCPDVALWGRMGNNGTTRQTVARRPHLAIGVMDWTWARPAGEGALSAYLEKLTSLASALMKDGHAVSLFGHSSLPEHGQDDWSLAACLAELIHDKTGVEPTLVKRTHRVDALRQTLARADVVVGTRLHSCLLAMLDNTPALALSYQPKTSGTYALLGLTDLCFDVETFDPRAVLEAISHVGSRLTAERVRVASAVRDARSRIESCYETLLFSPPDTE